MTRISKKFTTVGTLHNQIDYSVVQCNVFLFHLPSDSPYLIVSDSRGKISLCHFCNGSEMKSVQEWQAHGFEAWIAAFNYWQPDIVLTGECTSLSKVLNELRRDSPTFM